MARRRPPLGQRLSRERVDRWSMHPTGERADELAARQQRGNPGEDRVCRRSASPGRPRRPASPGPERRPLVGGPGRRSQGRLRHNGCSVARRAWPVAGAPACPAGRPRGRPRGCAGRPADQAGWRYANVSRPAPRSTTGARRAARQPQGGPPHRGCAPAPRCAGPQHGGSRSACSLIARAASGSRRRRASGSSRMGGGSSRSRWHPRRPKAVLMAVCSDARSMARAIGSDTGTLPCPAG